jgi:hypothetical protein
MSDAIREEKAARAARLREEAEAAARDLEQYDLVMAYAAKHNLELVRKSGSAPAAPETVAELIDCYSTHDKSPFKTKAYVTRQNYVRLMGHVRRDLGHYKIADLKTDVFREAHNKWSKGGKHEAMGFGIVTMTRMLLSFGSSTLESAPCAVAQAQLRKLHGIRPGPARKEHLTRDHVVAIIAKAHEHGHPGIALAQALQFECGLHQKDVIGEWVPVSEPGVSDVLLPDGLKWVRGLEWSEIKDNVLRHTGLTAIEIDLRTKELVSAEIARVDPRERIGAVIKDKKTGLPYRAHRFRREWKAIAAAAGVPKGVWNMDSRMSGERGPERNENGDRRETAAVS